MANHKSAIKRAKQKEIRRVRNKAVKTGVKRVVKETRAAESKETALKLLDSAKSVIDKAAKKGVLHKKTASRKISRLSKLTNTIAT